LDVTLDAISGRYLASIHTMVCCGWAVSSAKVPDLLSAGAFRLKAGEWLA
jgi:hypothetical protein